MAGNWQALQEAGQSLWYDNIERRLLRTGALRRLIEDEGVTGVTSNPTIFEKAITGSSEYDESLRQLTRRGISTEEIYEALVISDIRDAADALRDVYDRTDRLDGYVSIEVPPALAFYTEDSVREGKRLFALIGRPNVMIKVPATDEGIPAARQLIAAGIPVNVTLIFSISQYEKVMEAHIGGMEERAEKGLPGDEPASVASFFVSRIDAAVDARLPEGSPLRGKAAVANSRVAYAKFRETYNGARWKKLAEGGGRRQRLLWASTGTKNPDYPDLLYVDELIGPDTVNTVPPKTLAAFSDHGSVRLSIEEDLDGARQVVRELAAAGIDLEEVGAQLRLKGVNAFSESFDSLLDSVERQRRAIKTGEPRSVDFSIGALDRAVKKRIGRLADDGITGRIRERDPSVWKKGAEAAASIGNRLGWLTAPNDMKKRTDEVCRVVDEVRSAGFERAVLLGMGGSSLCPEVLRKTFGVKEGYLDLQVLDSTDPAAVKSVEGGGDLDKILFIVASKSGGTAEVQAFHSYFASKVKGDHFIAVTDPGTLLEKLAEEKGFRHTFLNPPDIGGRFSALSLFGLVPAALMGIDIDSFLTSGEIMADSCGSCVPGGDNPGIRFGAFLGEAALQGRNKLTLFFSPEIAALGSWIEQLVAESTGKEGKGILPVDGELPRAPEEYGDDRLFIHYSLEGPTHWELDQKMAFLEAAGQPIVRIALQDRIDLAGEFFRWEMATALCGAVLGINPFDEPNVKESKDLTDALLAQYEQKGAFDEDEPFLEEHGITLFADAPFAEAGGSGLKEVLSRHLDRTGKGDYVAVIAYVHATDGNVGKLEAIRTAAAAGRFTASTLGIGPRFLHSTGQLHKGGPDQGVFLQITCDDPEDLRIPGRKFGFSTLKHAQALGDYQALSQRGRRLVRCHISGDLSAGLDRIAKALDA